MTFEEFNQQVTTLGSQTRCCNRFTDCRAVNGVFIVAVLAVIVMMMCPMRVMAQQKWSLNKLNPLNVLTENDMRLPAWPQWATVKMPEVDLMPSWIELPDPAEIPAGLGKLHRTTKRTINNTVNLLNPFYNKPPQLVHRPPTGSRNSTTASDAKSPTTSSFWFPSFMANDESVGPSRTVHDFLSRPRPGR